MLNKDSTVFVAGHNGMVGSAVVRALEQEGFGKIITASRSKLDLLRQTDVEFFFQSNKIDHVVLAAAKVGGILANNTYPAEFIYQNLMIQSNVIHAAHISGVNNLVFSGHLAYIQGRLFSPFRKTVYCPKNWSLQTSPTRLLRSQG